MVYVSVAARRVFDALCTQRRNGLHRDRLSGPHALVDVTESLRTEAPLACTGRHTRLKYAGLASLLAGQLEERIVEIGCGSDRLYSILFRYSWQPVIDRFWLFESECSFGPAKSRP